MSVVPRLLFGRRRAGRLLGLVVALVDRQGAASLTQSLQTRARHILLRPSAQLTAEVAARRLAEMKRQIESGQAKFENLARANSEDGSAEAGGDLGWMGAGGFVPEFEEAMNALPLNGISQPVMSRFGVHLIQCTEVRAGAKIWSDVRAALRLRVAQHLFDQLAAQERTAAKIEYTGATPYFKPGTRELILPQ